MKAALRACLAFLILLAGPASVRLARAQETAHRFLYVAAPGVRNYLEYGGHGVLVFDIDHGHKFVKRIKTAGVDEKGVPINVKGICASAATGKLYVSTLRHLMCIDLLTDKLLWERTFDKGCDRMSITPDGQTIFLPSLEKELWYVVNGADGSVSTQVLPDPYPGSHNTVVSLDGKEFYLAGLRSPYLTVADGKTHQVLRRVGPFAKAIRPFTVNGRRSLCFVNLNELLGFEVGDLTTGTKLHRVEVSGFSKGPVKHHGCPSHGIGMTPDETELWVTNAHNMQLHIFDATVMPPKQVASVKVRDEPGWVTFTIDGQYTYPSTLDVIDTKTRKIVTTLQDEEGRQVQSEKVVEIDFAGGKPVRVGDQFGVGRVGR